jgi:hypothetical protein
MNKAQNRNMGEEEGRGKQTLKRLLTFNGGFSEK